MFVGENNFGDKQHDGASTNGTAVLVVRPPGKEKYCEHNRVDCEALK